MKLARFAPINMQAAKAPLMPAHSAASMRPIQSLSKPIPTTLVSPKKVVFNPATIRAVAAMSAVKPTASTPLNPAAVAPVTPSAQAAQAQGSEGQAAYDSSGGQGQGDEQQNAEEQDSRQQDQAREQSQPEDEIRAVVRTEGMSPEVPADWENDANWQQMQGFAGESLAQDAPEAMRVTAHVHNGRLCATGICKTPFGLIPVTTVVPAHGAPNGAVMAGEEGVLPSLQTPAQESIRILEMKASNDSQKLAAENLVVRSRAGDQNAMAVIATVREQATKGNPRAKRSVAIISDYIKAHPISEQNPFGVENAQESNVLFSACITLANGAPLSNARLQAMASSFGAEQDEKLFLYAVFNYKKDGIVGAAAKTLGAWGKKVVELGKNVGFARALQMVRLPGTALSPFSAEVGWEHGE
jgi:hypothetical protein